ncbi:MAG: Serine phosphatase RsbU, regulator of sigma subunit [Ignavibacteriae bacterium]|nr:MAG: Serine phosphatase RsbU, regulator of sigma subunit [Ignavibacteriota bacterium]
MVNFRKNFSKLFNLILAVAFFIFGLLVDIIGKNFETQPIYKDVFKILAFLFFFFYIKVNWKRESIPLRRLVAILILGVVLITLTLTLSILSVNFEFQEKSNILIPVNFLTIFISNLVTLIVGVSSLILLFAIRDIFYYKQKKNTARNFLILNLLLIATAISSFNIDPLDSRLLTKILFGLFIFSTFIFSFKMPWIVYLTKKDKALTILFSFLVIVSFSVLSVLYQDSSQTGKLVLYYSPVIYNFTKGIFSLIVIYSIIAFLSTIFHLPTADAFDKKMNEISSLHNLSKLITQVLDFDELVSTVTKTTLEVCEAEASWLEINKTFLKPNHKYKSFETDSSFAVIAHLNISPQDIKVINESLIINLREKIATDRKPLIIQNFKMESSGKENNSKVGSLIAVPLITRDELFGVLYATKSMEYGFDQEDLDIASAFADQAAIAIDNSKLIEKSIERERLVREMSLAQGMQQKLLPQRIPEIKAIEIEAFFSPAFEVGGDYYDFLMIDEQNLAIVIGDVSGKGISAAFYMSEMKGIFQSLCKIFPSPKQFLVKANEVISASIDKKSFISLVYATLNLETGLLRVARAGHCPIIHSSGTEAKYIRPNGIGLGMGNNKLFEKFISEVEIKLSNNDVLVFYTDGITEAHPTGGEEYGYTRLLETVKRNQSKSAIEIRDEIISSVNQHTNNEPPFDDITLIILKWFGKKIGDKDERF